MLLIRVKFGAPVFYQLKKIDMLPEVKTAISDAVQNKINESGYNWHTLQKVKLREVWPGFPVEHRTLYKICSTTPVNIHRNRAAALLDFFNIPYVENYGIISLKQPV